MLVRKGQRRLDGLDAMIVSLYAGGMTIPRYPASSGLHARDRAVARDDQQDHRGSRRRGDQWQHRELDALYPVIYLDAIMVKVRDGGHVRNKAAHIAVGVDMDGVKHVLGSGSSRPRAPSSGRRCART